jgi:hypothetical protein
MKIMMAENVRTYNIPFNQKMLQTTSGTAPSGKVALSE